MPDSLSTNLPYPLMVNAATGTAAPALPLENLGAVASDLPGADQRIAGSTDLGLTDPTVANDLTQSGWAILFASDADPAIQAQLQPLIDKRRQDVQDPTLFKIFSGSTGVLPGQTAASWAQQRDVSLTASVDPTQGVPYYVLIVGSPERISFEFQALLKMQWAVGRLYFDDVEDYGRYARAVVQYETPGFVPVQRKNSAIWVTRNPGDLATAMLSGAICQNFLAPGKMLGSTGKCQFTLNAFTNEQATKAQLIDILRGNLPGGPPSVIFTGSHGCNYYPDDPVNQRRLQGSLLSQEWIPGTPVGPANQICADDIPADARIQGAVGFLFACYSGGCPDQNSYYFNSDGSRITVAPVPFITRLPQALLSRGMLAVIAHVDMAFPYAFFNVTGTPSPQVVRGPLDNLMKGLRVGLAADSLSVWWSSCSAHLAEMQAQAPPVRPTPLAPAPAAATPGAANPAAASAAAPAPAPATAISAAMAQMTIARDDARNYIVLGDPATKLRLDALK